MSADRRARALRAAGAARQVEDRAQVAAFQSHQRVVEISRVIEHTRDRSRCLLGGGLEPGLRAHLLQAGARHLQQLDRQRAELATAAAGDQQAWDQARLRVRSLEKLVERLEAALVDRHRRGQNAEWQDLVTSRAARPPQGSAPGASAAGASAAGASASGASASGASASGAPVRSTS